MAAMAGVCVGHGGHVVAIVAMKNTGVVG